MIFVASDLLSSERAPFIVDAPPITATFHELAPKHRLPLITKVSEDMLHDLNMQVWESEAEWNLAKHIAEEVRRIHARIVAECCDDESPPRKYFDAL